MFLSRYPHSACPALAASSFPDVDENADYAEIERKMRALLAKVAVALDSAHEG